MVLGLLSPAIGQLALYGVANLLEAPGQPVSDLLPQVTLRTFKTSCHVGGRGPKPLRNRHIDFAQLSGELGEHLWSDRGLKTLAQQGNQGT